MLAGVGLELVLPSRAQVWRHQDGISSQAGVGTHFPHLQGLIHSPHKCLDGYGEQLPFNLTGESGEMKGIKVRVLREPGKGKFLFTSSKIKRRKAEAERNIWNFWEGTWGFSCCPWQRLWPQFLLLSRTGAMSKLIKAITDMMQSSQGSARKGKKPEPFSRSEFKKLIQQEFAPVKVPARAGAGRDGGKGAGGIFRGGRGGWGVCDSHPTSRAGLGSLHAWIFLGVCPAKLRRPVPVLLSPFSCGHWEGVEGADPGVIPALHRWHRDLGVLQPWLRGSLPAPASGGADGLLSPQKPPSSKYRSIPRTSDPDTEPMNKERAPAKSCVY